MRLKFAEALEKEIVHNFYKDMRAYLSEAYHEFARQRLISGNRDTASSEDWVNFNRDFRKKYKPKPSTEEANNFSMIKEGSKYL